jgi:hypothetical protein
MPSAFSVLRKECTSLAEKSSNTLRSAHKVLEEFFAHNFITFCNLHKQASGKYK